MWTYYDKQNDRLIQIGIPSNIIFWDNHWIKYSYTKLTHRYDPVIVLIQNFLKKGTILEAGCGLAGKSFILSKLGYKVTGVDYSWKAIKTARSNYDRMDLCQGDVRCLPFKDSSFDIYLSLGVIEHFWEGYIGVLKEMKRVLKIKGIGIVSFPFISSIRRKKVNSNRYILWEETRYRKDDFYQFIFNHKNVINDIQKLGFSLKHLYYHDSIKGIKDEIYSTQKILNYIYSRRNILSRAICFILKRFCPRYFGHIIYLVVKKNDG